MDPGRLEQSFAAWHIIRMHEHGKARISLRQARPSDAAMLRAWDEKPHVVACDPSDAADGEAEDSWDWDVELARNPPWREQLIAELTLVDTAGLRSAARPCGIVQIIDPAEEETHYWGPCDAGLRAIDIWIGEEADLGRGYGTEIMRQVIDRCFAASTVQAIVIDPLASNTRARRFYERLGFSLREYRRFGASDCAVYRLDRYHWRG